MDPTSPCFTPQALRAAKYAMLLQKLESSCMVCDTADKVAFSPAVFAAASCMVAPLPSSARHSPYRDANNHQGTLGKGVLSTPSSRGLSSLPSGTTDSFFDASSCTSGSFASYAPCWNGKDAARLGGPSPAARPKAGVAGAVPFPQHIFEVRVHKSTGRHEKSVVDHKSSMHMQDFCLSTAPTQRPRHMPRLQQCCSPQRNETPNSHCGVEHKAARDQRTASPTADEYLFHYLSRYRNRRSLSPPPTEGLKAARGDAYSRQNLSYPTAAESHGYSPFLPTPGCSPILTVQDADVERHERKTCDSPDIVCRLFTSNSYEGEEGF
ncbi:hypothetical protein ABL78_7161 [Leptomonas seymouri]|uniref:Uncharacterized protein n=1 Tax=Leptomonas seymouri TaxID=5684 RepID=A0A0N0P3L2_LEPSE|nr:hypothetical protein ABL78_7161 [Leptomonas seymouri]|eukprot:KPI83797.1 hypothetical protein ABL78_7161 [Leptomonas seymouri]